MFFTFWVTQNTFHGLDKSFSFSGIFLSNPWRGGHSCRGSVFCYRNSHTSVGKSMNDQELLKFAEEEGIDFRVLEDRIARRRYRQARQPSSSTGSHLPAEENKPPEKKEEEEAGHA